MDVLVGDSPALHWHTRLERLGLYTYMCLDCFNFNLNDGSDVDGLPEDFEAFELLSTSGVSYTSLNTFQQQEK
jgi:hypothetical protein